MLNLSNRHKKVLYVTFLVLFIVIGVVLRSTSIDKKVLFTDEAVHYSFIKKLWKSNQYTYKEYFRYSFLETLDTGYTICNYYSDSIKENNNIWVANSKRPQKKINRIPKVIDVNLLFQPYFYFKHLIKNNTYRYDPVYHGPFLYYVGDFVFNLAGEHSVFLLRLPVVITSVLSILFLFLYRKYIGKYGFLLSVILVTTSPGLIYYSNLANYENYIAIYNILGVGLLLLGIYKRSPWILFSSGVVLLVLMTIKETALLAWFCIVMAAILTYIVIYIKERPSVLLRNVEDIVIETLKGSYNNVILRYIFPFILTFIVGGAIFTILYSSFGGHPQGVHDGLTSWMYWKHTGGSSGHIKPFAYYTDLVLKYDFFIVFMFCIGATITLFTTRNKYQLFLVFWAFILWFTYSCIPYKTPWLIINFLIPFTIVAGIGWNILIEIFNKEIYKLAIIMLFAVMSINAIFIAFDVKWFNLTDENNELTYVHTYQEFGKEMTAIYLLSNFVDDKYRIRIAVSAPEYWPIPAYLFDYKNIGYFGGVRGRNVDVNADIIVNDKRDNAELREYLFESDVNDYFKLRDFKQRPGVDHTIFVKEELFNRFVNSEECKKWLYNEDDHLLHRPSRN